MKDSSLALNRVFAFTERIIDWYWSHGRERRGKHRVTIDWISDLYQVHQTLAIAIDACDRTRAGIALWGPSAAGKSTFLSQFVDDPHTEHSAISWEESVPYRFNRDKKNYPEINALNPYNIQSDASGCVTRFFLCEDCRFPTHPVQIVLGNRQSLMHAIAAGYLLECNRRIPHSGDIISWSSDEFLGALPDNAERPVDQTAFELALDGATTIERLIEDGHPRYQRLAQNWARDLRPVFLRCASDIDEMRQLIFRILWDKREGLNNLYEVMESYREGLVSKFDTNELFCTLDFANLLLDIESYQAVSSESENTSLVRQRVINARFEKKSGSVLIDTQGNGTSLFSTPQEFGVFQGLVWQLNVPLRADFLKKRNEVIYNLMSASNIYDVPGVTRHDEGVDDALLSPDKNGATMQELLSQAVKQGKTASIITRYALERKFQTLLVLIRAASPPSKPKQLSSGIRAIWRGLKTNEADGQRPSVPTYLVLTFLAEVVNTLSNAGIKGRGLENRNQYYERLGDAGSPEMVDYFAINYPHLSDGKIDNPDLMPQLFEEINKDSWFNKAFLTTEGKESFKRAMDANDGGVEYFLSVLSSRKCHSDIHRFINQSIEVSKKDIQQLLQAVIQEKGDQQALAYAALKKLEACLNERVNMLDDASVARVARQLLDTFGLKANQIHPLPRTRNDLSLLRQTIFDEISRWENSPENVQFLITLGLNEKEALLVLSSFAEEIDAGQTAAWLAEFTGRQISTRQSDHYRRYLAAKITGQLFGNQERRAKSLDSSFEMLSNIQHELDQWQQGMASALTPHYKMVIQPFIRRIKEVSLRQRPDTEEPQPGEAEIELILNDWLQLSTTVIDPE